MLNNNFIKRLKSKNLTNKFISISFRISFSKSESSLKSAFGSLMINFCIKIFKKKYQM